MTDDLKHRIARAWAEIEGVADLFDDGRKDPVEDLSQGGTYNRYIIDADILLELADIGVKEFDLSAGKIVDMLRGLADSIEEESEPEPERTAIDDLRCIVADYRGRKQPPGGTMVFNLAKATTGAYDAGVAPEEIAGVLRDFADDFMTVVEPQSDISDANPK